MPLRWAAVTCRSCKGQRQARVVVGCAHVCCFVAATAQRYLGCRLDCVDDGPPMVEECIPKVRLPITKEGLHHTKAARQCRDGMKPALWHDGKPTLEVRCCYSWSELMAGQSFGGPSYLLWFSADVAARWVHQYGGTRTWHTQWGSAGGMSFGGELAIHQSGISFSKLVTN